MEAMYKWARIVTAIFIGITFLAATWPFIMILFVGINGQTLSMLIEHLPYLLILVFLALSYRFMDKKESHKKRRVGFYMFLVMMVTIFIGSIYVEKILVETERKQQLEIQAMQEKHLKMLQENAINNAIQNILDDTQTKKTLDVSATSK